MIPAADAADAWNRLREQGVAPAGLGARDTLRLEAGMNLYGNDMDENFHPWSPASPGPSPSNPRIANSSAARRWSARSAKAAASWWVCCSWIAACCAVIRKFWSAASPPPAFQAK